MKMNRTKAFAAGGATAISLLMAVPALAAGNGVITARSVIGVVSAINGSTLTVAAKNGTTYTVDAANANVRNGFGKVNKTTGTGALNVGDNIAIAGTISGTTVAAQSIVDGKTMVPEFTGGRGIALLSANASFGRVETVNSSNFTLLVKGGTTTSTVTVATSASTIFKKNGQTDTASSLMPGERVLVMGTKDGAGNITAASVNVLVRVPGTKVRGRFQ